MPSRSTSCSTVVMFIAFLEKRVEQQLFGVEIVRPRDDDRA
jgi:hypothetical protein